MIEYCLECKEFKRVSQYWIAGYNKVLDMECEHTVTVPDLSQSAYQSPNPMVGRATKCVEVSEPQG